MGGDALAIGLAPFTGGASLLATTPVKKLLAPNIPKPNTSAVDLEETKRLGLIAAQSAVQSKEAEERRQRAAKRTSGVLTGGLGLPGTAPTATATLQPAEPRKSVLG